jgi:hypothetical protein
MHPSTEEGLCLGAPKYISTLVHSSTEVVTSDEISTFLMRKMPAAIRARFHSYRKASAGSTLAAELEG